MRRWIAAGLATLVFVASACPAFAIETGETNQILSQQDKVLEENQDTLNECIEENETLSDDAENLESDNAADEKTSDTNADISGDEPVMESHTVDEIQTEMDESQLLDEFDSEEEEAGLELYSFDPMYTTVSRSSVSGVSGDEIATAAANLIMAHEGSYGTVVGNDNGAVSLGILGWHGNNALSLMRTIVAADNNYALSTLGTGLYNEITNSSTSWANRTFDNNSLAASCLSTLLNSAIGQSVQNNQAKSDVSGYINYGINLGLDNAAALVFFADFTNQTWLGIKSISGHGSYAAALMAANVAGGMGNVTLNEMYIGAICFAFAGNNTWVSASTTNRNSFIRLRMTAYAYIVNLGWSYCKSGDQLMPYQYNTGNAWLQSALNAYQNAGLSVTGNYDVATQNAVRTFQSNQSLEADGEAGPITISSLINCMYYTLATTGSGGVTPSQPTGRTVSHYDLRTDGGSWNGTYYIRLGQVMTDVFFCDGTYTYYLQADGTPMKGRLTYHPDGSHIIYLDANGHEVFNNFVHVEKSIAGDAVDDYCYFDAQGYMYVDVLTYDQSGTKLLYANQYGRVECYGKFQFSKTVKWATGQSCNVAGKYAYAGSDGYITRIY